MLALERKATLIKDTNSVGVRAQPFGGAVQLRRSRTLCTRSSENSNSTANDPGLYKDFRILIRHSDWTQVKQFCLKHLRKADDTVVESGPSRELIEEFAEGLQVDLQPHQYVYQPAGFVVENNPTPTDNFYSRGLPTVKIYRIFEVKIVDKPLCLAMLTTSERFPDSALQTLAIKDAQEHWTRVGQHVADLAIQTNPGLLSRNPP